MILSSGSYYDSAHGANGTFIVLQIQSFFPTDGTGAGFDPPYCYLERDELKFRYHIPGSNDLGSCSASDKCVCLTGKCGENETISDLTMFQENRSSRLFLAISSIGPAYPACHFYSVESGDCLLGNFEPLNWENVATPSGTTVHFNESEYLKPGELAA